MENKNNTFTTFVSVTCLISLFIISGCKSDVQPLMNPESGGFFDMPWPSDTRRKDDGSLDLDNFPAARISPFANQIINLGLSVTDGFGLHSPVHFRLSGKVAIDQALTPKLTTMDDSPFMLINIDPSSDLYLERVPLKLDFDPVTTLLKPGNLLSLLPYPGYSLQPDTEYAAILYTGIKDTAGNDLIPSDLITTLNQAYDESSGLSESDYQQLSEQKQKIEDYTNLHTDWSADDVAAFSVYTTQNPTRKVFDVADAVNAISDEDIVSSVSSFHRVEGDHHSCPATRTSFEGTIEMPRWQHGVQPYFSAGGDIAYGDDGLIQNGTDTVRFSISFGCKVYPFGSKPLMIYAGGTGSLPTDYMNKVSWSNGYGVMMSYEQPYSGSRLDAQVEGISSFFESLGMIDISRSTLSGITFYNYLNPVAAIGNQLQSASEQIYLKRIALNIAAIFERFEITLSDHYLPSDSTNISGNNIALYSHSQGSSTAPLVLAGEPGFDTALIAALGSFSRTQALHRKTVRDLSNILLVGAMTDELDEYHPVLSVLETFHDPANGLSYLPHIEMENLIVAAGYRDGCVVIESALPMAFGLARYGLAHPVVYPESYIEGLYGQFQELLSVTEEWFPIYSPNLVYDDPKVGVFVASPVNHNPGGLDELEEQLGAYSIGVSPLNLQRPSHGISSNCDERYDDWQPDI